LVSGGYLFLTQWPERVRYRTHPPDPRLPSGTTGEFTTTLPIVPTPRSPGSIFYKLLVQKHPTLQQFLVKYHPGFEQQRLEQEQAQMVYRRSYDIPSWFTGQVDVPLSISYLGSDVVARFIRSRYEVYIGLKPRIKAEEEFREFFKESVTAGWIKEYGRFTYTETKELEWWQTARNWLQSINPAEAGGKPIFKPKVVKHENLTWKEFKKFEPAAKLVKTKTGMEIKVDTVSWMKGKQVGKTWLQKSFDFWAGRFLAGAGDIGFTIAGSPIGEYKHGDPWGLKRQEKIVADWTYGAVKTAGKDISLLDVGIITVSSAPMKNIVIPYSMGMGMGGLFEMGSGFAATRYMGGSWTQWAMRSLPGATIMGVGGGFEAARISKEFEKSPEKGWEALGQSFVHIGFGVSGFQTGRTMRISGATPYEWGAYYGFQKRALVTGTRGALEFHEGLGIYNYLKTWKTTGKRPIGWSRYKIPWKSAKTAMVARRDEFALSRYAYQRWVKLRPFQGDPRFETVQTLVDKPSVQAYLRYWSLRTQKGILHPLGRKPVVSGTLGTGTKEFYGMSPHDVDVWAARYAADTRNIEFMMHRLGYKQGAFGTIDVMPYQKGVFEPMGGRTLPLVKTPRGYNVISVLENAIRKARSGTWLEKTPRFKDVVGSFRAYGRLFEHYPETRFGSLIKSYMRSAHQTPESAYYMRPGDVKFWYQDKGFTEIGGDIANWLYYKLPSRFTYSLDVGAFRSVIRDIHMTSSSMARFRTMPSIVPSPTQDIILSSYIEPFRVEPSVRSVDFQPSVSSGFIRSIVSPSSKSVSSLISSTSSSISSSISSSLSSLSRSISSSSSSISSSVSSSSSSISSSSSSSSSAIHRFSGGFGMGFPPGTRRKKKKKSVDFLGKGWRGRRWKVPSMEDVLGMKIS